MGTLNRRNNPTTKPDKSLYHIFNEAIDQSFKSLIEQENWSSAVDLSLNAEQNFDKIAKIYTKNYNMAYPLKNNNHRRKNLGEQFFLGTQIYIL